MLRPLIWPQSEKITVLFPGHLPFSSSNSFWCTKNKLSLQRHSSLPVLSFDTEVEELNIATRADTMMTALSPPSSYSITNGRVWYQRLFPHQTTLRPPFINCLYCCKLLLLMLESPRRRRQLQKKRKECYFTRIPVKFYACENDWYQALISLPARTARVKGPGYEAKVSLYRPKMTLSMRVGYVIPPTQLI